MSVVLYDVCVFICYDFSLYVQYDASLLNGMKDGKQATASKVRRPSLLLAPLSTHSHL